MNHQQEICVKCKKESVTYDVPDKLCDWCWAEWFIKDWKFESEEERKEVLQEIATLQMEG